LQHLIHIFTSFHFIFNVQITFINFVQSDFHSTSCPW